MLMTSIRLALLLYIYLTTIQAKDFVKDSHIRLSRNAVHTLVQADVETMSEANHLHVIGPEDDIELKSTRELAATLTPFSYGENYQKTDVYPYTFNSSLVIPSGTSVSFSDITFSDSCINVGTSNSIDYGSGCAVVVPYNASLTLPNNFILDKGCIRVLGGALFGAQNLILRNGAKLEMQMDSIWVRNSIAAAKIGVKSQKTYDFKASAATFFFIHNTSYRGQFDTESLIIQGGSGIYITGGDSVASQEAKHQWKLTELHILDSESFMSSDGAGYQAIGPLPFASGQPSSSQSNHYTRRIEYNPMVNPDYSHGAAESWFGTGGTHAGMGGSILGLEFDSDTSSAYSATTDTTLGEEKDFSPRQQSDVVHLARSATSSAISYEACANSNKRTCSRRIVGSRGSAMKPNYWGGSGGSTVTVVGGNGGGHLRLIVNKVVENHGLITANGHDCEGDWGHGGGGAGGSIWITVSEGGIFGTGTIRAQGGDGCLRGGGAGSGGRIALHTLYPAQCTWGGDIFVNSGSQLQYHTNVMDSQTHENDHYIPYPRYPAGGTLYFADEAGANGELVATNNGVGGADITLFADEITAAQNYTIVNLKTLLMHDSGIHAYSNKNAGRWDNALKRHGGQVLFSIDTLGTLKAAAHGYTQWAGKSISGQSFGPYSPGDPQITYARQQQSLYSNVCPAGSTSCTDCKISTSAPVSTTLLWSKLYNQLHKDSIGGANTVQFGKLYLTNNSMTVLKSQLHVEGYSLQVVNTTLFVQSSVTIAKNGTIEISPYSALDADFGTSRAGYSRGCLNAVRSPSVLNTLPAYFANPYLRESIANHPRGGILTGSSGSKELTATFLKSIHNGVFDAQFFEEFFTDDPSATLNFDSDISDGYNEGNFPDMACLSFGDLYVAAGGKLRILPTETPPITFNVHNGQMITDASSSTFDFIKSFNSGTGVNPKYSNYSDILLQRSVALQQKAGASVLLVARTVVIEQDGIVQGSGVHTSKHSGYAMLNPLGSTASTAAFDSYATQGASGTYDAKLNDADAGGHLDVRRLARITTDGHGQPSDGVSGGGGGGNAGTGTPGYLSFDPRSLESAWGDVTVSSASSGGFGGHFRDINNIMSPFGAGGPGGAGLRASGGSGGAGLTILFRYYLDNDGSIAADGISGDTSNLESYGVGGGAGGSILIFSANGTISGSGTISARGGHAAIGGGSGSGGRVALDACTDAFTGDIDVRGGVAMLPLRQVQLLNNIASFAVSSTASRAFSNITHIENDIYPYTAGFFSDKMEEIATAAAGTGNRITRMKQLSDTLPVLISASSGTIGRYSAWDSTSEPSTTYKSRCVTAIHRNKRAMKVSVPSTWTVQEFFNFTQANINVDTTVGSAYLVGASTLSILSEHLMNAWTGRDRWQADTAHYANFREASFGNGRTGRTRDSSTNAGYDKYKIPSIIPNIIPALDTVVDLPILNIDLLDHPTFTRTTSFQGGQVLTGSYSGYIDDNFDDLLHKLDVQSGSHVTLAATRVNQLDLVLGSISVDSASSLGFPENIRFRGDGSGNIDLSSGVFFNRGAFRSARTALSMNLKLRKGAKLVLHAPLAFHKLLAAVKIDEMTNTTQQIQDLVEDFNYESPPGEDFSSEILGLQSGEVGAGVVNALLHSGANKSATNAFFSALRSIPTHDFLGMNLTENSMILGPVLLFRAATVDLHNSAITADGLGFYGGDNGDNPVVYGVDPTTGTYTDTYVHAGTGSGCGFAGGFGGSIGGDGGGHGGATTFGRSSMQRHAISEKLLGVSGKTVPLADSVMPFTTLLQPNINNNLGIQYIPSLTHANFNRSRGYGSPYAPILPGSGGGASSGGSTGSNGESDIGGRGGGVVVISVSTYLNLQDTCPGGVCANKKAMNEWNGVYGHGRNASLRSSLGHWVTRISADGKSTFGGGGGGAGGSVWVRYSGVGAAIGTLQGNGLISARGGQTCYFPESFKVSCVGQAEEQSAFDVHQGYVGMNQTASTDRYHVLDQPGGPGAGGRVRLELNTTDTFSGAVVAVAGYSHHSPAASLFLSGHRGTIVDIPPVIQTFYEPSKNNQARDTNPNTEYGIDIKINANQAAPIFAVQIIDITGSGHVLDEGVDPDGAIVGGTWQISYKGYTSGLTLNAKATAKEVYNALAQIPNSELRHINVFRTILGNYDASVFAGNPNAVFNGGYRYKITFCEDQYSLSMIKAIPGTIQLYTLPGSVQTAKLSISLVEPPTSSPDIIADIAANAVPGDYVPDGVSSYHGRWSANELKELIKINRNILGPQSYAYWRDKNTLRVVPGGHGLSAWDLRNLIYRGFKVLRLTPIPDMLGRILRLHTESILYPTPLPTGQPSRQPTGQPTRQPSARPTCQPTVQPTMQPSSQPSAQPSGIPTSQPSGQPTMQPTSQPSTQPSGVPSAQPSGLPTGQPTRQPSAYPSGQPSAMPSAQPTDQPSSRPTTQPSSYPTAQPSGEPSAQPSSQPSDQPSNQPSGQPSTQPTGRPSAKPTGQPSSRPSGQPSRQPTAQPTTIPTRPTGQPTAQPSVQPSARPTSLPSGKPSSQPSDRPSGQPSGQPTTQPTSPTGQPSGSPTTIPSTRPTSQPTSRPSMRPTGQPTRQPSSRPTAGPTTQPSGRPSGQPTSAPSTIPSTRPTSQPSSRPSMRPTGQPTRQPSSRPTAGPTTQPSGRPSGQPTSAPSTPTGQPSGRPTAQPSTHPTGRPTSQPSTQPTGKPSRIPTGQPTRQPTRQPTSRPSRIPTGQPTRQPTRQPTSRPSRIPTGQPTGRPTRQPTSRPTTQPSRQPTGQPTTQPSRQPTVDPSGLPTARPSGQPTGQPSGQPTGHPTKSLPPTSE